MTVERIVERANDAINAENGAELLHLLRCDQFGLEVHVAMLGALRPEKIHAVRIRCDGKTAHMM
jgi:hypothetical protein